MWLAFCDLVLPFFIAFGGSSSQPLNLPAL
eukprot:SAG11_NODE_35350_length_267_cov_0.601190_1_plen_29_part_01